MREDFINTEVRDRIVVEKIADALKTFGNAVRQGANLVKEAAVFSWGYVNTKLPTAQRDFYETMRDKIVRRALGKEREGAVVICIGAAFTEFVADNLGPMVGSRLNEMGHIEGVSVYGTMEQPIFGTDLAQKVQQIYEKHPSSLIINVGTGMTHYKWQIGYIHVDEAMTDSTYEAVQKYPQASNISVTPLLIHREWHDTPIDTARKVSAADRNEVKRVAEIIAAGLHSPLKDATDYGIFEKR